MPVDEAELTTVLGKAVTILRAYRMDDQALALSELVNRTGLHKATTRRLAQELVRHRLLDHDANGYRLSSGLFELGMRASTERSLLEAAMPFLQDVYERTHETVHLGVLEGSDVLYLAKIGGHRQAKAPSRPGGRMPVSCTALGKILLAFTEKDARDTALAQPLVRRTRHSVVAPGLLRRQLARVAQIGVAFEYEESQLGINCVAVPVFDGSRLVAAMSITGPTTRFRPEAHQNLLRAAGLAFSATLARQAATLPHPR